ncbi:MAG: hypothetical protein R3E90_16225 [Marinicella sp.]
MAYKKTKIACKSMTAALFVAFSGASSAVPMNLTDVPLFLQQ